MKNKSICVGIVDDDDTFQFITLKAVNSIASDNTVLPFSSSIDALKFLKKNAKLPDLLPDLLLVDINMPVIDGWMFLEEFHLFQDKIAKQIDIYMVSSSIDFNDIERAKQNKNILEYLTKPISNEKFKELLTRTKR